MAKLQEATSVKRARTLGGLGGPGRGPGSADGPGGQLQSTARKPSTFSINGRSLELPEELENANPGGVAERPKERSLHPMIAANRARLAAGHSACMS
jgi:hypothetical protein